MNSKGRSFEELDCWKAARDLRLFVARQVLPNLPHDEKYRLGDQVLRAARSTTANLAEGHGRFHYKENSKFCRNARGSSSEVLDHLITAVDENLLPPQYLDEGRRLVDTTQKLINGYIAYLLRSSEDGPKQPPTPDQ